MVNTDEPGIAKVMVCLWFFNAARSGKHNEVTMVTARIEDILVAANIISGIVYTENFMLEYVAIFEQDLIYHRLGSTA